MIRQVEVVGGVLRLAVHASLEVQVGCGGATCLSDEGYHLPGLHMLTFFHQVLRVMGVVSLQTIGMLDAHQIAVA